MMRALLAAAWLSLAWVPAVAAALPDVDWPAPGGDAGKTHFSALVAIKPANVGRLGLAWEARLPTNRGLEATPVVAGGVLYTSGVAGRAYAFDAATGKPIWQFTPAVDMQVNRAVCCDQVNRGVAVAGGRVFVAALDGKLYALAAASGHVLWSADTIADHRRGYSSTGAPEIAGGVVVIGNAGSDEDARGYVTAYDLATGRQRWRFWVVPHDPRLGPQEAPDLQAALSSWDRAGRWDIGGGGSPWDAIAYDPAFDAVYVGTGNGEPYDKHRRSPSGGDNLYAASIVALDPATGRVKWHFQETPGDSWDYDACEPMILTDLAIAGSRVPALLHASKNGFLFVIDRRTGRPIRASQLTEVNWTRGYDPKSFRPAPNPDMADYHNGPRIVFPATPGARNWQPGAYDPQTGLYYASILDMGNLLFDLPGPGPYRPGTLNLGAALIFTANLAETLPALPPPVRDAVAKLPAMARVRQAPAISELRAIDPLSGQVAWRAKLAGWQDRGGVLATAGGLVFQGSVDGALRAYDAHSGALLKTLPTGVAIEAAPMTYRIGGAQYVAVMAGWGGGGWPYVPGYGATAIYGPLNRLFVFKLDGAAPVLPERLPPVTVAPEAPPQLAGVTPARIAEGHDLFLANCAICHANQPRSVSPDLRRMDAGTHSLFRQIVRGGLLVEAGMPRWDDLLSDADTDAIHAWLIETQARLRTRELALRKAGRALDGSSAAILSSY